MKGKITKGRVLVKELDTAEKTDSGIIISQVETKQKRGEVVISASDEIEVGDIVLYTANGVCVSFDDLEWKLLREAEILYIE